MEFGSIAGGFVLLLAFGNVIVSSIFNPLGILGVTAMVKPLDVPAEIVSLDGWVMGASTLLIVVLAVSGWRIRRWEGAVLLIAYAADLVALAGRQGLLA